jgi:hypothetical protein
VFGRNGGGTASARFTANDQCELLFASLEYKAERPAALGGMVNKCSLARCLR